MHVDAILLKIVMRHADNGDTGGYAILNVTAETGAGYYAAKRT